MLKRNRVLVVGVDCGRKKGRQFFAVGLPGLMAVERSQYGVGSNYFLLAQLNSQIGTD